VNPDEVPDPEINPDPGLDLYIKFFSKGEVNRIHGTPRIDRNLIHSLQTRFWFQIRELIRIQTSKLNFRPKAKSSVFTELPVLTEI
jgi:hypothetical protein